MIELAGLAVLLCASGAAVIWKQLAAKHCPLHNRYAGYVAILIGAAAVLAGIIVLAMTAWRGSVVD